MQQEYDEQAKSVFTSSEALNDMWKSIMLPTTDDESADDISDVSFSSDSEVSTGTSDSSFLTDSSQLSSSEEDGNQTASYHSKHAVKKKHSIKRKVIKFKKL